MDTLPPYNHIFIDFENVHKVDLSLIGEKYVDLTLLLGPNHKKLESELVEKMLQHAHSVHLVRLTESGSNALDFALAYYVGHAAARDPAGVFHIISGDKGYDPLVTHLRRIHVKAYRHADFASLKTLLNPLAETPPIPSTPTGKPELQPTAPPPKLASPFLDELATRALEHLRSHPNNRPTKEATLARHLKALPGTKPSDADICGIIDDLRANGHIAITKKGAVTYHL